MRIAPLVLLPLWYSALAGQNGAARPAVAVINLRFNGEHANVLQPGDTAGVGAAAPQTAANPGAPPPGARAGFAAPPPPPRPAPNAGRRALFNVTPGLQARSMVRIGLSALLALMACVCVSAAQSQEDSVALLTGPRAVSELGATVTVIDVDSLRRAGAAGTLADLLTARVPGVAVFHGSGTIGTAARILMRGATSFRSGDAPQIYVDGIRIDDDPATLTIAVGGQNTSRVDDLNVEDIATIAVLPGPAATALYGSDAAN